MQYLLVFPLECESSQDLVEAIKAIDPTHIPGFNNKLRVVVDSTAIQMLNWLDEEETGL